MEELKEKETYETNQYIVIQIGQEQYGIDIRYIDNIACSISPVYPRYRTT